MRQESLDPAYCCFISVFFFNRPQKDIPTPPVNPLMESLQAKGMKLRLFLFVLDFLLVASCPEQADRIYNTKEIKKEMNE